MVRRPTASGLKLSEVTVCVKTAHGFSSHWSTQGQRRPPFGKRLAQPAVGNRIVWDHDSRRRLDCWILERSKVGELPSFSLVGSTLPAALSTPARRSACPAAKVS